MTKLRYESDKNKFCFFWMDDDNLKVYRFKTILFGYPSSPFILQYIIQYHLKQFPNDFCNLHLSTSFYADNLVLTGNSGTEMIDLYHLSCERMAKGGFELRSWVSNNQIINELIKQEGRLSDHMAEYGKSIRLWLQ